MIIKIDADEGVTSDRATHMAQMIIKYSGLQSPCRYEAHGHVASMTVSKAGNVFVKVGKKVE